MKIFKKILSITFSLGIIFSFAVSLCAFSDESEEIPSVELANFMPENLEECCLALDEIFSEKEKNSIKQSATNDLYSYLHELRISSLGYGIIRYWLYLSEGNGKTYNHERSKLAELLLEHGADFYNSIELDYIMTSMILDNYRRYLLYGKSETNIKDLAIDHWFDYFRCFDPDFKREKVEKVMSKWMKAKKIRKGYCKKQHKCGCVIA